MTQDAKFVSKYQELFAVAKENGFEVIDIKVEKFDPSILVGTPTLEETGYSPELMASYNQLLVN